MVAWVGLPAPPCYSFPMKTLKIWLGLAALLVAVSCSSPGEQAAEDHDGVTTADAPQGPLTDLHPLDPPAAEGAMAPRLSSSGADLFLTWLEPVTGDEDGHSLKFSRLEGHGDSALWSEPVEIVRGESFFANWADNPGVQRGGDGALVAWWLAKSADDTYAYDVHLARSTDEGRTWAAAGKLNRDGIKSEHGFVSAVTDAGGVRAFWLDGREMTLGSSSGHEGSGSMTLRTAVVGADIMDEELLDMRVCECCQTAATVAGEGPVVVYRGRTDGEIRDIWIARRTATGWSAPAPVHEDGWHVPGCPVNGPAVAARPDHPDQLAVAWFTAADDLARVQVSFSRDGGSTFSKPVVVDSEKPLGRVDLVWDGSGAALVLWLAPSGPDGEAQVLLRRVPPAGPPGAVVHIATTRTSRASGFPRMARHGSDLILTWTEPGEETTRLRGAVLEPAHLPGVSAHDDVALDAAAADSRPAITQAADPPSHAWDGKPGSRAPAYEATALDGSEVALADLHGQPLLVNFWATWCMPCRQETPALIELHERFAADGLQVVGVSVDAAGEDDLVRRFVRDEGVPYTTLLDPADRASQTFGLPMLPGSFLFDSQGVLVWSRFGVITRNDPELTTVLAQLLSPAPAGD
ncbi:MAG: TlpA family protein disulfide reductase [Acidobacteria bacterium]|nr:MAG: TlpA family protein disulfide reductase [Acidobacteriota bacterium]